MIRCLSVPVARELRGGGPNLPEEELQVTKNVAANRWEVVLDSHTAFAEYFVRGSVVTFPHTLVPAELEGRGIASRLAKAALEDARARGLTVVPRCPFFHRYIERHPEYENLVDSSFSMR
jgi:predicted GNAT family acetyltransferase